MEVKKLLIATTNQGKLREIRRIFDENGLGDIELLTLADFPDYEAPEETGKTFAANAYQKAMAAQEMSDMAVMAEDSGLTVDALDGAPGIYSARYAGIEQDDAANRVKLLEALQDVPEGKRQAQFRCSAVMLLPRADGTISMIMREGVCEGEIAFEEKGENGFGYDCLFYLRDQNKTMAEISDDEKNAMSHRGKAMRAMAAVLKSDDPLLSKAGCVTCGCC